MYLGRLCLDPDVDNRFFWLQSMCDKKLVVDISLELHLQRLIMQNTPRKGIVIKIDDFGAKSLINLLQQLGLDSVPLVVRFCLEEFVASLVLLFAFLHFCFQEDGKVVCDIFDGLW